MDECEWMKAEEQDKLKQISLIKIDGQTRAVHYSVLLVMEAMEAKISHLENENKRLKLLIGKGLSGQDLGLTGKEKLEFLNFHRTLPGYLTSLESPTKP